MSVVLFGYCFLCIHASLRLSYDPEAVEREQKVTEVSDQTYVPFPFLKNDHGTIHSCPLLNFSSLKQLVKEILTMTCHHGKSK